MTERLQPDAAGIARAAALLRGAACVAFPTETVYGLGADARSDTTVAGIYAAKDRPTFNPLIVHVPDVAAADRIARFDSAARDLAARFWPGPLTLVLPMIETAGISRLVTAGGDSIAVRVPAGDVAQALLNAAAIPLAAPSANPSGRLSPTSAAHVLAGLDGRIAAVIDGGCCPVGVESAILDLTGPPRLLRAGGIPVEDLAEALGGMPRTADASARTAPMAPGMLASHYAPRARIRLNATDRRPGEVLLGFGDTPGADENLSPEGDLRRATANLFSALHRLDTGPGRTIAVAPIPETGLGRAINDRLRRAAAPRR